MLRVSVLGDLKVDLDGAPAELPSSAKVRALLAWLALHPGPQPRTAVAARLWPDVLDASARASLRSAIWALRRSLCDADGRLLPATRDHVGLGCPDVPVWVDLLEFERLARAGRPAEALALDGDELLAGIDEEWVYAARDEHAQRRMGALAAAAAAAEAAGDLAAAIAFDRRRTALDPLGEPAHRDLIRRLAAAGDRSSALAVYAKLRDRMRRELALSPSPATRAEMEAARGDDEPDDRERRAAAGAAEPGEGERRAAAAEQPARDRVRTLPPLAGRDDELAALLGAWTRAAAGRGGAVVLAGEGGIGKTRLALELLARAEAGGATVAGCAALDLGGAAPFGLWAELLGELARGLPPGAPPPSAAWPEDVGRLAPAVTQRLRDEPAPAASGTGSPEFERARLFEAVVEMVGWAAARGPLVLLMEDVHLADVASLELAAYVGRRLPDLAVLLVLTRRDLPRRPDADALQQALAARGALLGELELAPLGTPALTSLVRSVAALDDAEVGRVVASSEGNALLAVEAARAAQSGAGERPPGLRNLVRAATGRLPAPARALTELTAVAGRDLAREELARLPVEQPAAAAAAAVESGLLATHDGRLGFRHALLRAAAYDDLSELRRAELHDQMASALEAAGRAPAAELGRHLRLAGRDDAAVVHLARAGVEARRIGALAEAGAFLEEALEIRPEAVELLLELGDVEAWRSRWEAADAVFERALAALEPGDEAGRARAHARRALWFRTSLCSPRRSATAYRDQLAVLEAMDEPPRELLVDGLAGLAWAEGADGDPDECDALLRRVHELTGGDLPAAVGATVNAARALALCRRGRFAESYAPMIAAAEANARAGIADEACTFLTNAACAAAFEQDFERALAYAERAIEVGGGALGLRLQSQAARAYVLSRLGRHREALAAAEQQCAWAERDGDARLLATAWHDLGQVALAAGDHAEAALRLGQALAAGAAVPRAQARLARAEALARLRRADEAEAELRKATLEPLRPGDFPETLVPRFARLQGLIAAARGDRALAARRLEEAAAGWRRQTAVGERAGFRVDLGRPPVAGMVEPDRELAAIAADVAALETVPV